MNPLLLSLMRAHQWDIVGRVGRDPEVKAFQSGNCITVTSVAVNPSGAKKGDGSQPDWFKVELWGDAGMKFADTVKKGDLIRVHGRARFESWTNRNGEEVTDTVLTLEDWSFVGKPNGNGAAPAQPATASARPAVAAAAPAWQSNTDAQMDPSLIPF